MNWRAILSRRVLIAIGAVLPVVGMYFIFDLHLSSVGRELFTSWLQSQAVEIQEGNLLTSISKNQRVLLSSHFVKGIVLVDESVFDGMRLIEIGDRFEPVVGMAPTTDAVNVVNAGFLHKQVQLRPSSRPDTLLVFDIESHFLKTFFYSSSVAVILFIGILLGSIRFVESREFRRREEYLKNALKDFITREEPSAFIEKEVPTLVRWWKEQKAHLEHSRQQEIRNQSMYALAELGARIAHDIRSPLNTIDSITDTVEGLAPKTKSLLERAIKRIRDIANEVGDCNRSLSNLAIPQSATAVFESRPETVLLFPIIEEVVLEKQVQYGGRGFTIEDTYSLESRFASASIDVLELKRTVSNLIDNAVESLDGKGRVQIFLRADHEIIQVLVEDNGRGIPSNIIDRVGERGFTKGKQNGSGLGVFYARQAVASWSGSLSIRSSAAGTTVEISLPRAQTPWIKTDLVLGGRSTLIGLDDDPTIHAVVQARLSEIDLPYEFDTEHFFEPDEFYNWHRGIRNPDRDFILLSDQNMQKDGPCGLDVIENLKISEHSVLVTSAFNDRDVIERCKSLGVSLLPKPLLPYVPIRFG